MATTIKEKPVEREFQFNNRPHVAVLTQQGITLRQKRFRSDIGTITWQDLIRVLKTEKSEV